jgi:hypothetical protein
MNKQTKLILSLIGIAALVVPAILLIVFTGKTQFEPEPDSGSRQIDSQTIKEAQEKVPQKSPQFPSPAPATPAGIPSFEGSPSAQ